MKSYIPKQGELEKKWIVIDAEDKVVGRIAVEAARILRGKHKPQFTPFLDCGDHVIVINAAKVRMTGNKAGQKVYYQHSGYPGGMTERSYKQMLEKHPERILEKAISGMLPHTRLGRKQRTNFRVYAGSEHPHAAQQPIVHELS